MSQQDAAKQQANTRNNIRVVSIFTAAAIGLVGVLVILYAWQLPPFTRHSQFSRSTSVTVPVRIRLVIRRMISVSCAFITKGCHQREKGGSAGSCTSGGTMITPPASAARCHG